MVTAPTNIPLGRSTWHRRVQKEPDIWVKNRYFETTPVNPSDQVSMLARPGLRPFVVCGTGPIRTTYYQPGTFNDDMFVVSGTEVYRVTNNGAVVSLIGTNLQDGTGKVAMAAAAITGNPDYLFIADGRNLWLYIDNGYATGTFAGTPVNNDTVKLGLFNYKFTTGAVDTGTPDGSVANPWLVAVGGSASDSIRNFSDSLDGSIGSGTEYSSLTTRNTDVVVIQTTTTFVKVAATALGAIGNATVSTAVGTAIHWTATTLTGGGGPSFSTVETPDDVGISDVCFTSNYIIAIPAQGQGVNGRFYWIEPAEITIDPLNFATAERAPDPIVQCVGVGDQFWLFGTSSTEVWYPSGDQSAPFQRVQGRLFDKGAFSGTAVAIKDVVIVVGRDGRVYSVDSSPNPISTPAIEEQIRLAIRQAEARGLN